MDDQSRAGVGAELPAVSVELELGLVTLQLITELAMAAGIDPDGSATLARAHVLVERAERLTGMVRARPLDPAEPAARLAACAALKPWLKANAPIVAQLARAANEEDFDGRAGWG